MGKNSTDRRSHARFGRTLQIEGFPDSGEGVVAHMVSSNLSLGGLYCASTQDFPEMARLAVRLMLPVDGEPEAGVESLDVEAVVVRRRRLPSGASEPRVELALLFTAMTDRDRQRLARYLARS